MACALREAVRGTLQQRFERHELRVRRRIPGAGGRRRVGVRPSQFAGFHGDGVHSLVEAVVSGSEELPANLFFVWGDGHKMKL